VAGDAVVDFRQWIKRGRFEAVQFTAAGRYRIPIVTVGGVRASRCKGKKKK